MNFMIEYTKLFSVKVLNYLAKNLLAKMISNQRKILNAKYGDKTSGTRILKRYITLALESWYINQNISGILKKCAETSGINYDNIVKGGDKAIAKSQYEHENDPDI